MIDLRLGDCLEVLKTLPDNSVDSVVTDAPYHLTSITKRFGKEGSAPAKYGTDGAFARASKGFMGKEWDGGDIAFRTDVWEECLRVLKPGGHLLSFGGSRTYHRMAVAIEDAGFEIRDQIMWIYASGFPKSHNIGKAIDKIAGRVDLSCDEVKLKLKELYDKSGKSLSKITEECGFNASGYIKIESNKPDPWTKTLPTKEKWEIISKVINTTEEEKNEISSLLESAEREVIGKKSSGLFNGGQGNSVGGTIVAEVDITIANIDEAKEWEGWGTALKPAHEPICMARKPLSEKSIAENVLKHGTGGINIDDCRIEFEDTPNAATNPKFRAENNYKMPEPGQESKGAVSFTSSKNEYDTSGRFPANIMFDEEAGKLLDEQSGDRKSTGSVRKKDTETDPSNMDFKHKEGENSNPYAGQSGGASRFFYCPKVSKKERNAGLDDFEKKSSAWMSPDSRTNKENYDRTSPGMERFKPQPRANNHPTVKPIKLMEYLITLVTPKGGVVLEPFMGSGSTGIAAKNLGMSFIGIEREEEYFDIAKQRIGE